MHDLEDHFRIIEHAVLSGHDTNDWRVKSWARCLRDYKLNPSRFELVELGGSEIREEKDTFGFDLSLATSELEATLTMIEGGGYSAHIANQNGVVISERWSRDSTYYCTTDRVGAVWKEELGGTNGIGTAIKTKEPTAVYLADHFFADLTGQACAAAPFFGPDGSLIGVLNLSTRNPGLPTLAHRVVYGIAQMSAERLETQYFRDYFRRYYTLTISHKRESPIVLAIDSDTRIVGATRKARAVFGLDDAAIGNRSMWAVFEKIRGNPTLDYLCEHLRELRPLGQNILVDAVLKRPLAGASTTPIQSKKSTNQTTALKFKRYTTLADCVGQDPTMQRNVDILRRVLGTGLHVLLLGETGVGKDTLARALHYEGERASGPFVAFNCAAIPETLIDSELFGYSSGAFTGANKEGNSGRIVEADKGTLFLDEIGDMPLPLQTRLLRFLETGEVTPLGSGKTRSVDVQVIAATHQNLHEKVASGTFREDLFYRLAGTILHIPALRERKDMPHVIRTVLASVAPDQKIDLSQEAMLQLCSHKWPGNIRELRNVLTRAARLAHNNVIQPDDLLLSTEPRRQTSSTVEQADNSAQNRSAPISVPASSARGILEDAEKAALTSALEAAGGDPNLAASILGVSRATFYRKLKKFDLRSSKQNSYRH